jgi:hypothetical protein
MYLYEEGNKQIQLRCDVCGLKTSCCCFVCTLANLSPIAICKLHVRYHKAMYVNDELEDLPLITKEAQDSSEEEEETNSI